MSCSWTGSSMCSRSGGFSTATAKPASPVSSQAGAGGPGCPCCGAPRSSRGCRGLEGDDVALADPVARDGDPLAVDQHVAVADELAGLAAAGAPAGPEDHVVEAQLEVAQQVLAGDAGLAAGLLVEVAELLLQEPVDAAGLLLLAQLGQVLRALAHAVAAVLAGRVGAAVAVGHRLGDGALERVAALALQEQLGPLTPAEAADGSGVSSHRNSSSRPGAASWGGSRCGGWG
jgi:hypothetical protein